MHYKYSLSPVSNWFVTLYYIIASFPGELFLKTWPSTSSLLLYSISMDRTKVNPSLELTIIRFLRSPCLIVTISPFPLGGAVSPWWSLWFGFAISSYFAWGMWWLGTFSCFSQGLGGIFILLSWAGMFRFTWNDTTNSKALTNVTWFTRGGDADDLVHYATLTW